MTVQEIKAIGVALITWATSKGMKPHVEVAVTTSKGKPTIIMLRLMEQFNADPRVPNTDYLSWKETHPGIVTGIQDTNWNGKPSPQVRGGWADFVCPVSINPVWSK